MPSPLARQRGSLSPPAYSPLRLHKLIPCALLLLFAGGPVEAFNHGKLVAPTTLSSARQMTSILGAGRTSPLNSSHHGRLMMAAEHTSDMKISSTKLTKKRSRTSAIAAVAFSLLAFTSSATVANAAKKVATEAVAAPAALVLPTIPRLALVCLVPTLLGYYKSEYGVSYGYGTAMAASSYLILSAIASSAGLPILPAIGESLSLKVFNSAGILASLGTTLKNLQSLLPTSLPAFHAFALLFYGTRLDLFLFYREVFLPRFRAMRERIEDRAKKQGNRLKRTPFLISCAFLYFCMICPLLVTSTLTEGMGMARVAGSGLVPMLENSIRVSVVMTLVGFLLGAFGDMNKTLGKALKGEDELITGGIFRFFRHPNYTGEVIGWTSSCLAGFLAVAWKAASTRASGGCCLALFKSMAPYLVASFLGSMGITFVLATATTGLEFRQKEKYGDTEEYKEWVKKSWVGFKMPPAEKKEDDTSSSDE